MHVHVYPSICLCNYPSIYLSCLCNYPSIHPSTCICLSNYPSIYLSIHLSVCLTIHLSITPSIYMYLSLHPSTIPSIHSSIYPFSWGEFSAVLKSGKYKRRQLSTKDVENIARTMVRTIIYVHGSSIVS